MRLARRSADESGVALITALLAVMLMSALMVGMFAALATDTRSHAVDRDQTQAYAAAHAGLEKLTSGLATLFVTDVSPSVAQINNVSTTPPVIPGFSFTSPGGAVGSGYAVSFTPDAQGNPASQALDITTGPFTGFKGIITPYTVTVTAVSTGGAEVRLRREIQTVAVPVFQFGVFSDSDLTFYAGDDFAFGGRVHTNQNLFLCEFAGIMTFADRITAVKDVIHNYFSNGLVASTYGCSGTVNILTAPGTYRNLRQTPNEGSVTGMPGSAVNPSWSSLSTGTYKSYIRTGSTGAKKLDLPLVSQGATPVDLIRRPALNSAENVANSAVYLQRYYAQASLRILLSDRAADITGLPTVTGTAPVQLDGNWVAAPPAGYGTAGCVAPLCVDATHPPIARSIGPASTSTVAGSQWNLAGAANLAQIRVAAIPASYKLPVLTVNNSGVNVDINCTGKNGPNLVNGFLANSFFGCTRVVGGAVYPAAVLGGATTVTATLPSGAVVTRNATATAVGTITLAANDTALFSQNMFWLNTDAPGTTLQQPIQCQGYSDPGAAPRQFINCYGLSAANFPLPAANAGVLNVSSEALVNQNVSTIGGFLKIEKQDAAGVWTDVTTEILNLGIGARNQEGTLCADPTPNAVIRIQRLRDNIGAPCTYAASTSAWDWWPNTLYDTREGNVRDIATTAPMNVGGVMQYVAIDVGNLKRWFAGNIGTTGTAALNNNGYIVYFSDRRGDHDENNADNESAEYGFEDQVNPTTVAGTNDNILQGGEDMNGNGTQQVYGETPHALAIPAANGPLAPYDATGRPWTVISVANAGQPRVNKVPLFRRALKLVNGGINGGVNNLPTSGLTVAAENPVYVQGNYNATTDPNAEPNVPASVVADAVTLLSNNWTDPLSFESPNSATTRNASTTGFRLGVVAGKGLSFDYCAAACGTPGFLFGTDGGVGNFLRLLEDWNTAGVSINYRGSLVTLHISRQATGTFKYNTNVYDFGTRNFTFDTDFLTPSLLPPGTPMFRDINTLKFRQILRPNQ